MAIINVTPEAGASDVTGKGSAPGSAGSGQLIWTREEIILAMDFYVTCGAIDGGPIPGQHSDQIARLSALLKKLSAYPPEVQGATYRNTDGVYLKLMNLRAVQTGGAHGMNRISQTDTAVWRDYIDNLGALHAEATAIRQRLEEGVLAPASTTTPDGGGCAYRGPAYRAVHGQPRPASRAKPNAPRRRLFTATRPTWRPRASPSAGRNTGPGRSGRCSATCGYKTGTR